MKDDSAKQLRESRVWLREDASDLDAFRAIVERSVNRADYPFASDAVSNVLVYDGLEVRSAATSPETRKEIMAEWVEALADGPGVIAIRSAFAEPGAIDAANAHFWEIIEEERRSNVGGGDHFAKPGANDRVWNALEKLCLRDPAVFAAYYGNPIIALVSEAWLGPAYQITSQLNVVNPGGAAQVSHRDYHLGFQSPQAIERFPAHVHRLSPVLTLQGAVAHCDMPLETGPTLYLPFSQSYLPGYIATARAEFRDYFDKHHVQLPLAKGDAVFFNPALFHAAGTNRSKDVRRIANLLQVSSAFGRAMESVDRLKMSLKLYPALKGLLADKAITAAEADNAILRGGLRLPDQSRPRSANRRHGAQEPTGADPPGAQGELGA
jgi:ectoine hydroxylase-related dioxygenase (phytanoyl-CoA dioxygenase family)